MEYLPRFFNPPEQSFFLFGPRGSGKTTWLRERLPDALFVNLLRPEVQRETGPFAPGQKRRCA